MMALRPGMYVLTEEQFKPYREAYEKQKPKKPDRITKHRGWGLCANCKNPVFSHNNYCNTCGQKLKWSDDNE